MEVGEHDLALAHARPLGLDRLLHLDHHLGLGPHVRRLGDERRAHRAVRLVGEPRADPGTLLHQHVVSVAHQRLDARGYQRHTVLGRFDLLGHPDDHARSATFLRDVFVLRLCVTSLCYVFARRLYSFPSQTTVCRSGAKNSAATAAISSSVSPPTAASTWSRLWYGSPCTGKPAKRYIRADGLSRDSISWPCVCCFASASAAPVSPARASLAYSSRIAAAACDAVLGWVPT